MSYISEIRPQDAERAQENCSWYGEGASGVRIYAYVQNDPLNLTDPFGLCDNPQGCGGSNGSLLGGTGVLAIGATAACAAAEPCGAIELGGIAAIAAGAIILNSQSPGSQSQPQAQQPQSPSDILTPGGTPIGTPNGNDETIRNLPGGQQAAQELFGQLSAGGTPANQPTYPGTGVNLPGGGFVGIRPASKSGGPAIDVNIPGINIGKIHFP